MQPNGARSLHFSVVRTFPTRGFFNRLEAPTIRGVKGNPVTAAFIPDSQAHAIGMMNPPQKKTGLQFSTCVA